jgi:hypothetical protein
MESLNQGSSLMELFLQNSFSSPRKILSQDSKEKTHTITEGISSNYALLIHALIFLPTNSELDFFHSH